MWEMNLVAENGAGLLENVSLNGTLWRCRHLSVFLLTEKRCALPWILAGFYIPYDLFSVHAIPVKQLQNNSYFFSVMFFSSCYRPLYPVHFFWIGKYPLPASCSNLKTRTADAFCCVLCRELTFSFRIPWHDLEVSPRRAKSRAIWLRRTWQPLTEEPTQEDREST
ncbi:hypothetical protein BDZ91DRAFT_734618 [Kalaharituber pfeilii]|nr:hypothetical protein BDZ91DRAFT_734618 [Kalaharituber pfeilii]